MENKYLCIMTDCPEWTCSNKKHYYAYWIYLCIFPLIPIAMFAVKHVHMQKIRHKQISGLLDELKLAKQMSQSSSTTHDTSANRAAN